MSGRLTNLTRQQATTTLTDIATLATLLAQQLGPQALTKAEQWEGFLRSPTGGRGGNTDTPTEAAALNADDNGATARAQFCTDLTTCRALLRSLEARARAWTDTRPPKQLPPECTLCYLHAKKSGIAVYSTTRETRCDLHRCSWHHDQHEHYQQDLNPELTQWHHAHPGGRRDSPAFVRLLREHHPDLWAKYHSGLTGAGATWQTR